MSYYKPKQTMRKKFRNIFALFNLKKAIKTILYEIKKKNNIWQTLN